jgi:hypothetical protein
LTFKFRVRGFVSNGLKLLCVNLGLGLKLELVGVWPGVGVGVGVGDKDSSSWGVVEGEWVGFCVGMKMKTRDDQDAT